MWSGFGPFGMGSRWQLGPGFVVTGTGRSIGGVGVGFASGGMYGSGQVPSANRGNLPFGTERGMGSRSPNIDVPFSSANVMGFAET